MAQNVGLKKKSALKGTGILGSGTRNPLVNADRADTIGQILRATVGPEYTTAENIPIQAWQRPTRITVTWE